jgi:hypothetical protein
MGGDQFSRTLGSNSIDESDKIDQTSTVSPVSRIVGKKVGRKVAVANNDDSLLYRNSLLPRLTRPKTALWNTALDAVSKFNENMIERKQPFSVRVWANNKGFRIQLIEENSGVLVKQTEDIPFLDVTGEDLNHIINSLASEHGVIVDIKG